MKSRHRPSLKADTKLTALRSAAQSLETVASQGAACPPPEVIALTECLLQWHSGSLLGITTQVAGHMPHGHRHRLPGILTKKLQQLSHSLQGKQQGCY